MFHCQRQISKFTRHLAGTERTLAVSPHGWVDWSGITRYIRNCLNYHSQQISEDTLLTEMAKHVSGVTAADDAQGKERFEFLVEVEMARSRIVAVRATHGMSEKIGVPIWVTHAPFPSEALDDIPALFHRTSIEHLQYIIQDGLKPMGRVGTMFSLFAPWDMRSKNMQRGGSDNVDLTVLIIMDTRRLFCRFGWRNTDCGIWLSEAGACIPQVLSIDEFCKQIVILNLRNVKMILSRSRQGD